MKPIFFLPIFFLLVTGCSSIYFVNPENASETTVLNQLSKKSDATVILKDRTEFSARDIIIKSDSVSFEDLKSEQVLFYPTGNVLGVKFLDRMQGLLEGFKGGFLAGGGLGFILGLPNDKLGPVAGALVLGTISGVAIGITSSIFGYLIGSETIYYIK